MAKNSFNMSTICLLSSRMIWTICTGRLQMLIFEEVSGTSCARHAPPRVFRVASSLCPELSCVHAQSWLWDLAARSSNSSISILHTSARGGNFPKTSYRNFLASPPPPNCFTELFNRRRNWSRSALPLQHWTCVRVHSAGLLLFFVKKKVTTKSAKSWALHCLFVTHCGIVSLVVLQRPGFYCSRKSSSWDPSG